jgi:adenine deaminase
LSELSRRIAVARGKAPADLILVNARVINVFNGDVVPGNVAILGDTIVSTGDNKLARTVIDLEGRYVAPGLINGHTHLESSMLSVAQYARAVVPHGTTAVVSDLHEIANVAGIPGIRSMLDQARGLPLDLWLMAPSCVPATHLETSGAEIDATAIAQILKWPECIGLGEVMNFLGILNGDHSLLRKIKLAQGKVIDGHAPGLSGSDLIAYVSAGITSDHECISRAEAEEKLAAGMFIMVREGSTEKNLAALLPLITDKTYRRCLFVVDDRSCLDLERDGDIDAVVRKAIRLGLEPVRAIQLATLNSANYFRLRKCGAVAPGYKANLTVIDNLARFQVNEVYYRGKLVAQHGEPLFTMPKDESGALSDTVKVKPFTVEQLGLPARGDAMPVIEVVPGQIVTRKIMVLVSRDEQGNVCMDRNRDVLKLVVIERHRGSGRIGLGLVSGFGLKQGALASSVAHDSHNIVSVGTNDRDIYVAVQEVVRLKGGLVAAVEGKVIARLGLPVAGLLSPEPLEQVNAQLAQMEAAASALGSRLGAPFATLSFLALPVIPELRLTDHGLVDVTTFSLI